MLSYGNHNNKSQVVSLLNIMLLPTNKNRIIRLDLADQERSSSRLFHFHLLEVVYAELMVWI